MDMEVEFRDWVPDAGYGRMLNSNDGEVARDLYRRGQILAFLAKQSVTKDTGALANSIEVTFIPGPTPTVMVGSNLDYAYYVHEGTRPHEIEARPGRTMRFKIGGRIVYAQDISHPGTDAQKFLSRHLRKVLND